ncbi:MAG: TVP38/TMEM64 family protein [Deltaproteobacteria bacterium]|nr:TVP38/TMEM64 family protein [Deltaproteobacteria bacterium]
MTTKPSSRLRLVALGLAIVLTIALVRLSGVGRYLEGDVLPSTMRAAGPLGVVVFVVAFTVGVLAYLPGALFVAAGVLAYGPIGGYAVNLLGGVTATCASFAVARAIGGQPIGDVERPFVRRMLARIDKRPIFWLAALRLVTFISPPLNTALALSRIRFREFAIGSAIGLVVPMAVATLAFDGLVRHPAFAGALRWLLG